MPFYKVKKRQAITSGSYWIPGRIIEMEEKHGNYWVGKGTVELTDEEPDQGGQPDQAGSDGDGDTTPEGAGDTVNPETGSSFI